MYSKTVGRGDVLFQSGFVVPFLTTAMDSEQVRHLCFAFFYDLKYYKYPVLLFNTLQLVSGRMTCLQLNRLHKMHEIS